MTIQRLWTVGLTIAIGWIGSSVTAQEENAGETQAETRQVEMAVIADDSGGAPMIFATESIGIDGGPMKMRVMGGDGAMMLAAPGMRSFGGPPDEFSLLNDPSVQKDLELVGEQLEQVRSLQSDFAKQMKEQIGDLTKGGIGPDRFKGVGELMRKIREQQQAQMQELLLPHQIERLQQVALQKHMNQAGAAGALASQKLAEALGITDEQKARLKQRQEEIEAEVAKKLAKIKEDAKNELLAELTATQREKLKEMTGEKFSPKAEDIQEDFRRRIESRRNSRPANGK